MKLDNAKANRIFSAIADWNSQLDQAVSDVQTYIQRMASELELGSVPEGIGRSLAATKVL